MYAKPEIVKITNAHKIGNLIIVRIIAKNNSKIIRLTIKKYYWFWHYLLEKKKKPNILTYFY